jgi:hypothetical protein
MLMSSARCCKASASTETAAPSALTMGRAKKADGLADPFAVVIERPVGEVSERALAGIEPVMEWEIVCGCAAMFTLRRQGMVVGMHGSISLRLAVTPQGTVRAGCGGRRGGCTG